MSIALLLPVMGCVGRAPVAGAVSEPPPPRIEPALARGSRLGDARAARGGTAAAGSSVKAAVIPVQTPQAFTLAVPLEVEVMTNVAVR